MGAPPIDLIDGERLCDLLKEHQLGGPHQAPHRRGRRGQHGVLRHVDRLGTTLRHRDGSETTTGLERLRRVTQDIELVYNRLVADEKLKSGTKYERLAALVFNLLTERETVHDLRLRGATGVKHQIDAVVGDERKRVLIEAKDYDRSVDLPVVRNFWAVVEDLQPDEAFIVTTEGYSQNAITYAEAKGIKLAVLRIPRDEDWENIVREVRITLTATMQAGPPQVTWELHSDDRDEQAEDVVSRGTVGTDTIELADERGNRRAFLPILEEQLHEDYGAVPLGGEATIGRLNRFEEPTWLIIGAERPRRVSAWQWTVDVTSHTEEIVTGEGVGGLAAELVLRTVDGSMHRMFTNHQIEDWTFDGKKVVPRRW